MAGPGMTAPGRPGSAEAAGNGWRGPESTCPGLGPPVAGPGSGLAAGGVGRPGAITAAGACKGLETTGGAGGGAETTGGAGGGAAGGGATRGAS